jgi:outer membrane protein assembly factor BamE (lipoprotein component of BamABCDE complex)
MLSGCSASYHAEQTQKALQGEKLTVGTVQKEIRKGMSGAEVLAALGSPNIVSTDEAGREVWVYDKISSDVVYSSGGFFISTGSKSASQQTLTIIIKYDEAHKVRDFAYHTSRF